MGYSPISKGTMLDELVRILATNIQFDIKRLQWFNKDCFGGVTFHTGLQGQYKGAVGGGGIKIQDTNPAYNKTSHNKIYKF